MASHAEGEIVWIDFGTTSYTTGGNWNNNDVATISGITGLESFDLSRVSNSAANFLGGNEYGYINALQIEIVPEPSSAAALLGLCSITVACLRRRRD